MGIIMEAVAVFEIHIDKNQVGIIRPAITLEQISMVTMFQCVVFNEALRKR